MKVWEVFLLALCKWLLIGIPIYGAYREVVESHITARTPLGMVPCNVPFVICIALVAIILVSGREW